MRLTNFGEPAPSGPDVVYRLAAYPKLPRRGGLVLAPRQAITDRPDLGLGHGGLAGLVFTRLLRLGNILSLTFYDRAPLKFSLAAHTITPVDALRRIPSR